jgi:class 3 adenylate cyclase
MGYTIAVVLNQIGNCHQKLGQYHKARDFFENAISEASESYNTIIKAMATINLGETLLELNKPNRALEFFDQGLDMARLLEYSELERDALFGLYRANNLLNETPKALSYHEYYQKIADSLNRAEIENIKANSVEMQLKKRDYEKQNLQFQLQRKEDQQAKIYLYIGIGLLALVLLGLTNRFLFMRRSKKAISKEKDRSDALLNNILPEETAEELKANGSIKARQFDQITVLFTDFKGFSVIAEQVSPEKLVDSVDYYFKHFDGIVEKYGLEKIKTIGDAYMCAGGLPKPNETHPEDVLNAAIEMRDFVEKTLQNPPPNIHPFEIRIGLNTGPVVAGVVGVKKFAYDIWGSTVNFAARMESKSEPGRINVSESTYQLLKDKYNFTYRGELEVKNGQVLKMYFAEVESKVTA